MKVLTIDIETAPNLGYFWSLWKQNIGINQIAQPGEVIAFAAKWYGDRKIIFHSTYHDSKERMLEVAHRLLDEADVIVHYNGTSFDMPWLRTEFILAGMQPPSPWVDVDLLRIVQRQFRFPSNKLAYVTDQLGLSGKLETGGFELWRDCMTGEEDVKRRAWAKMRAYNKRDVRTTEELLEVVRPWAKAFPLPALYADSSVDRCRCGSENLERRGFTYTNLSKFPRFRCRDCGAWGRSGKAVARVDVRPAR